MQYAISAVYHRYSRTVDVVIERRHFMLKCYRAISVSGVIDMNIMPVSEASIRLI